MNKEQIHGDNDSTPRGKQTAHTNPYIHNTPRMVSGGAVLIDDDDDDYTSLTPSADPSASEQPDTPVTAPTSNPEPEMPQEPKTPEPIPVPEPVDQPKEEITEPEPKPEPEPLEKVRERELKKALVKPAPKTAKTAPKIAKTAPETAKPDKEPEASADENTSVNLPQTPTAVKEPPTVFNETSVTAVGAASVSEPEKNRSRLWLFIAIGLFVLLAGTAAWAFALSGKVNSLTSELEYSKIAYDELIANDSVAPAEPVVEEATEVAPDSVFITIHDTVTVTETVYVDKPAPAPKVDNSHYEAEISKLKNENRKLKEENRKQSEIIKRMENNFK